MSSCLYKVALPFADIITTRGSHSRLFVPLALRLLGPAECALQVPELSGGETIIGLQPTNKNSGSHTELLRQRPQSRSIDVLQVFETLVVGWKNELIARKGVCRAFVLRPSAPS